MPGMMETVLNIGLNDYSVNGLIEASGNPRFAWDSYRRLVQMFGKTVLDIEGEVFANALHNKMTQRGLTSEVDMDADDLRDLVEVFKTIVRDHTACARPSHSVSAITP